MIEEDTLMRVIVILMIIGDLMMDEGPLEEDIMIGVKGRPIIVQQPQVTLDTAALEILLEQLASQCCNWLGL